MNVCLQLYLLPSVYCVVLSSLRVFRPRRCVSLLRCQRAVYYIEEGRGFAAIVNGLGAWTSITGDHSK